MDLANLERARSGLVQFLVLLIMIFLGLIGAIAYRQELGAEIPGLCILSLLACLYVIAKERRLRNIQHELVEELISKDRQVSYLDRKRREEKGEHEELEGRLRELTGLYRAISTVNAVDSPERTPEQVLRAALELVSGDTGSIMLVGPDGRSLEIVTAVGLRDEVVRETRQDIEQGVAGWVVRHQEPILLSGDIDDEDDRFEHVAERPKMNVAMSIPLALRGKVLGVLNLGATAENETRKFSDQDMRHASIFAQHASVAIENAHLLGVVGIGDEIGFTPDPEQVEKMTSLMDDPAPESIVLELDIPEGKNLDVKALTAELALDNIGSREVARDDVIELEERDESSGLQPLTAGTRSKRPALSEPDLVRDDPVEDVPSQELELEEAALLAEEEVDV